MCSGMANYRNKVLHAETIYRSQMLTNATSTLEETIGADPASSIVSIKSLEPIKLWDCTVFTTNQNSATYLFGTACQPAGFKKGKLHDKKLVPDTESHRTSS